MPAGQSARARAAELREAAVQLHAKALKYERGADHWDAGAIGEERVAQVLNGLDRSTTRVLHDRLLEPGRSKANIDHLVVSPAGAFLIDTKNWTGDVTVVQGSLFQHSTGAGSRPYCKNDELEKVRAAAARIRSETALPVTPVLCLAADDAEKFGSPQAVRDVPVVPINALRAWLESQPTAKRPIDVATVAVDLSCRYPEATGNAITLAAGPWPVASSKPAKSRESRGRRSTPRRPKATRRRTVASLLIAAVVIIACLTVGPKVLASLSGAAANAMTDGLPNTPTSPAPHLTTATKQRLEDWKIRAGLYKAHEEPSALPFVQPADLGSESAQCRSQLQMLAPFRRGLVRAPDRVLAADAKRYDRATHQLLRACIANRPVALHNAEGRMDVAASSVNTRYNRLLGLDPASYTAETVL